MKVSRIALLLIAVIAVGLAVFLALGNALQPPPQQAPAVEVAQVRHDQVLIAKTNIGLGERLGPSNLEWQDWPQNTIQPAYITASGTPDAIDKMKGSVARFELFKGEPVLPAKLVTAEQGYLSAVLDKGKRGVSISVSADSASGGFIVPNDHVDVILTRNGSEGQTSETLLSNVRVLAINTRLGETGTTGAADDSQSTDQGPKSQVFANSAIATLELDPVQAETIVNATQLGRLSLALRSIVDFAQANNDDARLKRNAPIHIIRYGQDTSVMAGQNPGSDGSDASVNPASFRAPSVSVGTQITPQ